MVETVPLSYPNRKTICMQGRNCTESDTEFAGCRENAYAEYLSDVDCANKQRVAAKSSTISL